MIKLYETIIAETNNGILTVTLNRPEKKNAMNSMVYSELTDLLLSAEENDSIHACILTGTGNYFSSGADLQDPSAIGINPVLAPVGKFMLALMRFPKIIVAAVNGPAVGIGVTLLPHCDICYASPEASFWVPFARIALVPEFCSSVTLPRILGTSLANEMLMMGKKICAAEARSRGLVSEIFSANDLLKEARSRVQAMLDQPLANDSLPLFKKLMKRPILKELEDVFYAEMAEISKRAENGDTERAIKLVLDSRRENQTPALSRL